RDEEEEAAFGRSNKLSRTPPMYEAQEGGQSTGSTPPPKRLRDPAKKSKASEKAACLQDLQKMGNLLQEVSSRMMDNQMRRDYPHRCWPRHSLAQQKSARAPKKPRAKPPSAVHDASEQHRPARKPESQANPENDWEVVARKPRTARSTRPDAVIVHASGKSYSEVLAMVTRREDKQLSDLGRCVSKVRRTNNGNLLLEVAKGSAESATTMRESIEKVLGDIASVRATTEDSKVLVLEVRNIDPIATKQEVCAALAGQLNFEAERVKVRSMRRSFAETQTAIISLPVSLAKALLHRGESWLAVAGLELAAHKTEAVLISSRKAVETASVLVGGTRIRSQRAIKYLGVIIDTRLSFKEHLEYVHQKASGTAGALSRMLTNTRGPRQYTRKLLSSVVTAQILYAAPVWSEAVSVKSYMRGVEATYRLCAIRIACSFRTISEDAALVIAGQVPLTELIRERKEISESLQDRRSPLQVLSGHGCFRQYLKRFSHEAEDWCPECGSGIVEDAHHVLFECRRFGLERQELEEAAGSLISAETLVPRMLEDPKVWEAAETFSAHAMKTLRAMERRRKERPE
ncbi:hypothetical protein KR059_002953, partial [Drosophila kikkawai]